MDTAVMDLAERSPSSAREIIIEFLYLDLETCTRCRATDTNLEVALAEVGRILGASGVEVSVQKVLVASAERARTFGFVSSPTIRVNGQDIALELRESNCDECGEACGRGGAIDCRLWVWQGREYPEAPTAMIIDAILREVYGGAERAVVPAMMVEAPENLERYFAGKARLNAAEISCCEPAKQATCCEPSEKASCCGDASSGSCGCQS